MSDSPRARPVIRVSERLRRIAADTVSIVDAGRYRTAGGVEVGIAGQVAAAVAGTRHYLPDDEVAASPAGLPAVVEVTGESTVEASRRVGPGAATLVFASARNPGGGFLKGTQAQEESLARSSALYHCLRTVPEFYAFHRADKDLRYSDRVIYSPDVPVFRDDDARLLDRPFTTAMLTAAAPNLGAILAQQPDRAADVPSVLRRRAERVLRIAAAHGHRTLVLGAWGCGVFGNDAATVADAFAAALGAVGACDRVVFAILDRTPGHAVRESFAAAFAPE